MRAATDAPEFEDTTAPTAYTVGNISTIVEADGTLQTPGKTATAAEQDITGFATDTGVGVSAVFVQVQRQSNGTVAYGDGCSFQPDKTFVEVRTIQA